jgi:5-methyltetrahydrofolate--homocysteine methyltransferase
MLIIGERINATRSRIAHALRERDAALIAREARIQAEAGASFIDINAGSDPAREVENLEWALEVVQRSTDLPVCLDSPNSEVLRRGLKLVKRSPVMLNSVTGEEAKMKALLPLAAESGALLVALAMDDRGLPETADRRVEIATKIVETAERLGVNRCRIYVDPCVQPLSTSPGQAEAVRAAVGRIMQSLPGVHTTCGLSNISFGLPNRGLLNRVYIAWLIAAGLDSAIIDPTAEGIMDTVRAAEALAGRDEFCMSYIRAMRAQP